MTLSHDGLLAARRRPRRRVRDWRAGRPISRRQFLADAVALAERLPAAGAMLNLIGDRYRFAVGLARRCCAATPACCRRTTPRHRRAAARALRRRLRAGRRHAATATACRPCATPIAPARPARDRRVPRIDAELVAAYVLTSGSTGDAGAACQAWGLLVANARAEARRLAESLGRADAGRRHAGRDGAGAAHVRLRIDGADRAASAAPRFDAGRPFFPADIAAALARVPRAARAGDDAVPSQDAARCRARAAAGRR